MVGAVRKGRPHLTHLLGEHKKVAIIGTSSESLQLAPWDDPSWVFWVHTSAGKVIEDFGAADVFLDIHPPECFKETRKNGFLDYYKWLQGLTTPVLMQQVYPEIPASIKFPRARIKQQWPYDFGSQAAAAIGLAMYLGAKEIGFWGVEYKVGADYERQRAHTLLWVGLAMGCGIRVITPHNSELLKNPDGDYGYESHDTEEKRQALKEAYRKVRNADFDASKLLPVTPENEAAVRALRARKQPKWAEAVADFGAEEAIPQELLELEERQRAHVRRLAHVYAAQGLSRHYPGPEDAERPSGGSVQGGVGGGESGVPPAPSDGLVQPCSDPVPVGAD